MVGRGALERISHRIMRCSPSHVHAAGDAVLGAADASAMVSSDLSIMPGRTFAADEATACPGRAPLTKGAPASCSSPRGFAAMMSTTSEMPAVDAETSGALHSAAWCGSARHRHAGEGR